MHVHAVLSDFDDTACDVGAVVADALQGGQDIGEDEALFDGAEAAAQAVDVAGADLLLKLVDDLFKGLDQHGGFEVVVYEGIEREAHGFADGVGHHAELTDCFFGERKLLFKHFEAGFCDIVCVVADALEIADHVKQLGLFMAVFGGKAGFSQLYKVGAQHIFEFIATVLILFNAFDDFLIISGNQADGVIDRVGSNLGHGVGDAAGTGQRDRGRDEQTLVQQLFFFILALVTNEQAGQINQLLMEGHEKKGGQELEKRVNDGDAHGVDGGRKEGEIHKDIDQVEKAQPYDHTDDIEQKVNH